MGSAGPGALARPSPGALVLLADTRLVLWDGSPVFKVTEDRMIIKQIGIDIGKNCFHVIGLDEDDRIVLRKQFPRSQLIRFLEHRSGEALNVAFGHAPARIGWRIG